MTKRGKKQRISRVRQQQNEARRGQARQTLLHAAQAVLVRKGYHNTLISDIVAEAGMGQGSFYRSFTNKRHILEVLFDEYAASLISQFADMSAHLPTNEDEYFTGSVGAIKRVATGILKNRALVLMFLRQGASIDRAFERKMTKLFDQFAALAKYYLEHAITNGFARPCNTTVVAQSIVGIGLRQIELWLSGRLSNVSIDEVIKELAEFAFWGFGPGKPGFGPGKPGFGPGRLKS